MTPSKETFVVGEISSDSRRKSTRSIKQNTYSAREMSEYVIKMY